MANDPAGVELGVHIALGGIIFQFVAIIVYIFLTSEFLVRYHFNKPFPHRGDTFVGTSSALDSKTEQMIFGVYFGSLCMFIRYFLFPPSSSSAVGWLSFLVAQGYIPHRRIDRWFEW